MLNIALDGPAGSGKSTVAKAIANKLDILYLDTGAMYRACALKCLQCGVDVKDEPKVAEIVKNIDLEIKYDNGGQVTVLDGKDVSSEIRKPEISMLASTVSAHKCVRLKMVEMQRKIAASMDCVLDGREIGSFVLPNAEYKFFVTAKPEVRAERRYKELIARGNDVNYEELLKEIKQRDYNDSHREFAPLVQTADAVYIDTSDMTIDEVVAKVICVVKGE